MLQSQTVERVETNSNSDETILNILVQSPVNKFKADIVLQICKIIIYLIISVTIFSVFYRSANFRYLEENYFSSDELFFNKSVRGMVPNLSGRTKDLIGNWKFVYISDQESDFIPFTISFNLKNVLRVRRSNCLDNKVLKWKGYDHNINIWEEKDEVSEMEIKNLQEDEECIKQNNNFLQLLKESCIWTIEDSKLYLVIEKQKKNSFKLMSLGFQKL